MAEEGIDDGGSLNTPEDKTSENDILDGIPDEDESLDKKKEPDKSEIVQKRKWREKYLKSQERIRALETQVEEKKQSKQSTDIEDKELAAQRYIREMARKEYEAIQAETKAKEEKILEDFQDKLDTILEEYPDFTEDQILEACEEYDVEPKIA